MAKASAALKSSHGDQINSLVMTERFEYHSRDQEQSLVWEANAWVGGDLQKLQIKTEGHYSTNDNEFEDLEIQALYSRAVTPFWDVNVGLRYDDKPTPSRHYVTLGIQGLAPYWFEIDGALFVSEKGDVSGRLELEYELRFQQRLFLQPRVEVNTSLSDVEELGVSAGDSNVDAGFRLRYEIWREFAPYIGVSWHKDFSGNSESQGASLEPSGPVWLAGIRFWF